MKIELSKEAEEAIKLLDKMMECVEKFKETLTDLPPKERVLVGGFVGGIFSPTTEIAATFFQGHPIYANYLLKKLNKESEDRSSSLPGFLDFMKDMEENKALKLPSNGDKN